ncbi:MAG: septum formation family protein [Pseudoclavibacter sp.]
MAETRRIARWARVAGPAGRPSAARLVAAGACAVALLSGCASAPDAEPEERPITQIEVGDCFDTDAGYTTALVYTDCAAAHLFEAFHIEELTDERFPGDEAIAATANEVCDEQFQVFTGMPVSQSPDYLSTFFGPTEDSWMTEDDRAIVCTVMPVDGQARAGSAAGE